MEFCCCSYCCILPLSSYVCTQMNKNWIRLILTCNCYTCCRFEMWYVGITGVQIATVRLGTLGSHGFSLCPPRVDAQWRLRASKKEDLPRDGLSYCGPSLLWNFRYGSSYKGARHFVFSVSNFVLEHCVTELCVLCGQRFLLDLQKMWRTLKERSVEVIEGDCDKWNHEEEVGWGGGEGGVEEITEWHI
jgi:hypothetical protein